MSGPPRRLRSRVKNVLDDVAEDGEIFKPPAPSAAKYVLDKSLGGLAS